MSTDFLECNHCGGSAIESDARGYFTDGTGTRCMSCGFPGSVSADSETEPYWNGVDDLDAKCEDTNCIDCYGEQTGDAFP